MAQPSSCHKRSVRPFLRMQIYQFYDYEFLDIILRKGRSVRPHDTPLILNLWRIHTHAGMGLDGMSCAGNSMCERLH